jgi:hypothetical protein
MLFPTRLNVLLRFLPSVLIAVIAATAIRAAMRPYSMAVAPLVSRMKLIIECIVPSPLRKKRGPGSKSYCHPAPDTLYNRASDQQLAGLDAVTNAVERVRQVRTERAHRGDGSNSNQSCNQAVFDGGGALLVGKHFTNILHYWSPNFEPNYPAVFSSNLRNKVGGFRKD